MKRLLKKIILDFLDLNKEEILFESWVNEYKYNSSAVGGETLIWHYYRTEDESKSGIKPDHQFIRTIHLREVQEK